MDIEFDPAKDAANIAKHGVSLVFGAELFGDADHVIIASFREEDAEDRYKVVGSIDGKLWTAVHVLIGNTARFISVRRSNSGEERAYRA